MKKLILPILALQALVSTTFGSADVYYYLAQNGFVINDPTANVQKTAIGILQGTTGSPDSVLGRSILILEQQQFKLDINELEKEQMKEIYESFGGVESYDFGNSPQIALDPQFDMGTVTADTVAAAEEQAERLGLDPSHLEVLKLLVEQTGKTAAFDEAARQLEATGKAPMTLNARKALSNEIDNLQAKQLNHRSIGEIVKSLWDAFMSWWELEDERLGKVVVDAAALLGNPINMGSQDYADFAPLINRKLDLPPLALGTPYNQMPGEAGDQWGDPEYDPYMEGVTPGDGTGTSREWRGYVETDVEALRAQLPPQAKHLAESFVAAGQRYDMDPVFLMSISRHETGNWTSNAFLNRNNAMGVSNKQGVVNQTSHHASIMNMGASLAGAPGTKGFYNNSRTVGEVGAIYAPVGAKNDPRNLNGYWPTSVGKYYDSYSSSLRG